LKKDTGTTIGQREEELQQIGMRTLPTASKGISTFSHLWQRNRVGQ
jgi:hypothetical protein